MNHVVPGPPKSPNDRGECLKVISASRIPYTRCHGRMIAKKPRLWVCSDCGKQVHIAPAPEWQA